MADEFGRGVHDFVPIWGELGLEIFKSAGTPTANGPKKGALVIDTTNGKLYQNTGTVTAATWNEVGGIAASEISLAEGNLLVGNASGVGVALDIGATDTGVAIGNGTTATIAALSGDATMTNAGVVTVAAATGNFDMGGTVITSDITATSGPGAVAITGAIHEITTTGTGDALTLANGTAGQRLTIIYVAEGAGADTAVLTPTTLAGGSTITFNSLGDSADLTYSSTGGWYMHGGTASIA